MAEKILILTGHSLYAEGIVRNLMRSAHISQFDVVDLRQPNSLQTILKSLPDILIVDGDDPDYTEDLKGKLFKALPKLKLILLDSETARVRVVQWVEQNVPHLNALLDELNIAPNIYYPTLEMTDNSLASEAQARA